MWVKPERDGPWTILYLTDGNRKIQLSRINDPEEADREERFFDKMVTLLDAVEQLRIPE